MLRNGEKFGVAAGRAGAALTGSVQATDEPGNAGWVPSSLFQLAR